VLIRVLISVLIRVLIRVPIRVLISVLIRVLISVLSKGEHKCAYKGAYKGAYKCAYKGACHQSRFQLPSTPQLAPVKHELLSIILGASAFSNSFCMTCVLYCRPLAGEKIEYSDQCAAVFNLACAQALAGNTNEALESLVQLRDLGWLCRFDLEQDADLHCMQSQPWLAEFLATLVM